MEFFPGDNITCRADGNPSPSYTWRDLKTGIVLGRDYVLEINQNMTRGDVYSLECLAESIVSSAKLTLRFLVKNSGTYIGIVISIMLFVYNYIVYNMKCGNLTLSFGAFLTLLTFLTLSFGAL